VVDRATDTFVYGVLGELGLAIFQFTFAPSNDLQLRAFSGRLAGQVGGTKIAPERRVLSRELRKIGVIINPYNAGRRPFAAAIFLHANERLVG